MLRPGSFALILATVIAMTPDGARADLVGVPIRPPPLDAAEQQILELNPDLALLAESAPWVLRRALTNFANAPKDMGEPAGWGIEVGPAESRLLGRNPALQVIYQASPEAAAELLALIRTAAGSGGRKSSE